MMSLCCYRYKTSALAGPWRRRAETALDDAVKARQAQLEADGTPSWRVSGEIERSECRRGAACGGIYPPE